jgi:exopolysaccharide production protein ExoQ
MSKAMTHPFNQRRLGSSASIFDIYATVPVLACVFVEIASPLLRYADSDPVTGAGASAAGRLQGMMAPRPENKTFWPALAAITLVLIIRNWSRLTLPPHLKWLFAYLALAGTSVLWAFKPDFSSSRFVLEMLIVTSIVLPAQLAAPTADMMRGVFLCFAFACVLNIVFVFNQSPIIMENVNLGYPGYFTFKGLLGECAAIAFLLSLHELLYSGWRRALGIVVICIATYLMVVSKSKGSLGLSILAPILAGLSLFIGKKMRLSPAIVLLPIPICYALLAGIVGNLINRISWYLYGNYTLSGRTIIWDFVNFEIARKPLFGWGYQSFWLVGPDGPSAVDGPGWVKGAPSAHNGYLDTMVDMGYVGFALLVVFIFTTLFAIGRLADREPARAWSLLTVALFVILTNFLETTWMHGTDMMWLIFVIVAAEAGRHWQPFHPGLSEPMHGEPVIAVQRPGLRRAWGSDRFGRFQKKPL